MAVSGTGPSDSTQAFASANTLAESAQTNTEGQALSGTSQATDTQRGNNYSENVNESTQNAMGDVTARQEAGRAMMEHQSYESFLTDLTQAKAASTKKAGAGIAATAG